MSEKYRQRKNKVQNETGMADRDPAYKYPMMSEQLAPQVTFLDDNEDLRSIMISLIESRLHMRVLELANFQSLLDHADAVLATKVVVLDIDLGFRQPSGLDAFAWLRKNNYQGKVFILTGHARSNPKVALAEQLGAYIWEKPIGSSQMIQKMAEFMTPRNPYEAEI
ncbi:MAG: response regulator [Pseudobdellovibrionaceae bacterium]